MPDLYTLSDYETPPSFVHFVWDGNKDSVPSWFQAVVPDYQVIHDFAIRESRLVFKSFNSQHSVRPGGVVVVRWNVKEGKPMPGPSTIRTHANLFVFETLYRRIAEEDE